MKLSTHDGSERGLSRHDERELRPRQRTTSIDRLGGSLLDLEKPLQSGDLVCAHLIPTNRAVFPKHRIGITRLGGVHTSTAPIELAMIFSACRRTYRVAGPYAALSSPILPTFFSEVTSRFRATATRRRTSNPWSRDLNGSMAGSTPSVATLRARMHGSSSRAWLER